MCGIAAIHAYRDGARPADLDELRAMNIRMAPRGPDGHAVWRDEAGVAGLGHRRLAIIDPSPAGAQPMADASGRYVISFNGEIYNYKPLRDELAAAGTVFQSGSDTEVMLHLYDRDGPAMVEKLRGMFTFALWDTRERTLFVARDPLGIKPVYYHDDGTTIRLASQVKALLASGAIEAVRSAAGQVGFLSLGYVPDPHTWIEGISALPAGCTLLTGPNRPPVIRRYFNLVSELEHAEPMPGRKSEDIIAELRAALVDSIQHHLVADVPVGAFLSAGLDSTAIVGLASEHGHRHIQTTTLGFAEFAGTPDDEVPLAEAVARAYGTQHRTVRVTRADFAAERDQLLDQMDQPSIDGVNTYFVARATAAGGLKVALSGLGGDEMLGGYPSFSQIPSLVSKTSLIPFARGLGRAFRVIAGPLIRQMTSPKYAGVLEYGTGHGDAYLLRRGLFMPWELPDILSPEVARQGWEELNLRECLARTVPNGTSSHALVSALEMSWYMNGQLLRDADWAGMAQSLEIRVPFVDVGFFRRLAPALVSPSPPGKTHLARVCGTAMPDAVRARPKTGFSVPVRDWLGGDDIQAPARGLRGWARYIAAHAAG
jgi:asparagine synthase (glutamine-hydrolysing)